MKESFAPLAAEGPRALEYFYARLFVISPDARALYPLSMISLRRHAFAALTRLVWSLDNEQACNDLIAQLGCGHRRFGVTDRHHHAFFAALRDTVKYFNGADWRPEMDAAWRAALDYVSAGMRAAAEAESAEHPPWWIAEIVEHDLRSPGVAVLKLAPTEPLPYEPGQHVPVQVTRWPRIWREYSIANAPRPSGLIELHVRAVPGGLVSDCLVHHSVVGDTVVLGKPRGRMTLPETDDDLLCIAGGTGLAPIKALIESATDPAGSGPKREITLFVGARQHYDLYDMAALELLAAAPHSGLSIIPVLSDEPGFGGLKGLLPDVVYARARDIFDRAEAYICGPSGMVRHTAALLAASMPAAKIHYDPPRDAPALDRKTAC